MELELYKMDAEDKMQNSVESYELNISKISTGRANPGILNGVKVIYYDTLTPIGEISNITVPEPRQLLIKPYDMAVNKDIAAAINNAKLGIQAVDEGEKVRISFPELTTERRKELVKSLSNFTEQAKIGIRSGRQDANKHIKSDEELSEDDKRHYLEEIQILTNKYTIKIDELTKIKEKDLMTI